MATQKCDPRCTCGRHKSRRLSKAHRQAISDGQRARFLNGSTESHPGKKRCTKCRRWKRVPEDFQMRKKKLKSGVEREYPAGECRLCAADRIARWRRKERKAGRLAKRDRRYYENEMKRDPQAARRRRRELQTVQRRKAGAKSRGPWKRYREKGRGGRFPIEPFSSWLASQCVRTSAVRVAEKTGYDERQIRRITSKQENGKPIKSVALDTMDKIFVRLGHPHMLSILYPE